MRFTEIITTALISLRSNKGRTALTMLGVIIGVFSVVILVSLGQGIQNFITGRFNALGSNLVIVAPGNVEFNDDPAKAFSRNKLEGKHVDIIKENASDFLIAVTPSVRLEDIAEYKNKTFLARLIGGNEDAFDVFNFEIIEGEFFSRQDVRDENKVAIIGPEIKRDFFGTNNAIGKKIKIRGESFVVIGVFGSKGESFDTGIIMPYTTQMSIFEIDNFTSIASKIKDADNVELAMKQIEIAMLRDLEEDEFTVLSQSDILGSIQNILGILTAGLGAIAGISLIVGGIGIMNIMLVSVNERIKEIGLRKALGATSRSIGTQFLFEAIFIGLSGGTIGLILGYLGSYIAGQFIETAVPLYAVFLSFFFSVIVGVVFGTYPAVSASKLDPIDALRRE